MTLVHGTCIAFPLVEEAGVAAAVLLRGLSGIGKSDLALRLIDDGAQLVADDQVDLATSISQKFPLSHGGPVHVGNPADIGIISLNNNIDGLGLNNIQAGETAMFWACGVTAIEAAVSAGADLTISHAPAHMLITDRRAWKSN